MALNSLALESEVVPVTMLRRRDVYDQTVFAEASSYARQRVELGHYLKHCPFTVGIDIRELKQHLRFMLFNRYIFDTALPCVALSSFDGDGRN